MRQKIWCTSDGQLIRLAIPASRDLWINLQVLWTNPNNSVFRILSPERHGVIVPNKDWRDSGSLDTFAEAVGEWNPVTTEFENVPVETLEWLADRGLIARPNISAIELIQDRLTEKLLASSAGWTPVRYGSISCTDDLEIYLRVFGSPCILKTRREGYDGKGQWRITEGMDLQAFWKKEFPEWQAPALILEKMIDLDFEASVIVARDKEGWMELIGPLYNIHEGGTLRYTIDPAPISDEIRNKLLDEAKKVAEWVSRETGGYVGLLTIEFFIDKAGKIYVNEFAPRPHNSGHATLDSRDISQNHLWLGTVSGWLVQSTRLQQVIVMENILSQQEFTEVFAKLRETSEDPVVYDYQKLSGYPDADNRIVRKLGHINHRGDHVEKLLARFKSGEIDRDELMRHIRFIDHKSTRV